MRKICSELILTLHSAKRGSALCFSQVQDPADESQRQGEKPHARAERCSGEFAKSRPVLLQNPKALQDRDSAPCQELHLDPEWDPALWKGSRSHELCAGSLQRWEAVVVFFRTAWYLLQGWRKCEMSINNEKIFIVWSLTRSLLPQVCLSQPLTWSRAAYSWTLGLFCQSKPPTCRRTFLPRVLQPILDTSPTRAQGSPPACQVPRTAPWIHPTSSTRSKVSPTVPWNPFLTASSCPTARHSTPHSARRSASMGTSPHPSSTKPSLHLSMTRASLLACIMGPEDPEDTPPSTATEAPTCDAVSCRRNSWWDLTGTRTTNDWWMPSWTPSSTTPEETWDEGIKDWWRQTDRQTERQTVVCPSVMS